MKNKVSCENCNSENDFFKLNCDSCGSLLRDKFPNIDLFSTIWQLIESPTKAIKKIIFSEHKNYQLFILVLVLIKLTFTSFFLQSIFIEPVNYQQYFGLNFGIGLSALFVLFLTIPFIMRLILKSFFIKTRYKDNLAVLIYSQIPIVLFLVIILPLEFALFGKYWLFSNPSPFIIKETAAYVFSCMELLAFIWSFVLFGIAIKIQSNSKPFAIISTSVFVIAIFSILLFIPYFG